MEDTGYQKEDKKALIAFLDKVIDMIREVIAQLGDPYYQGVPATIAFFLFLSIVPIAILASQIFGLFSLSIETVEEWAQINMTGEGLETLQSVLHYSPSGGNGVFLAIIAMWAASRTNFNLMRVANYTFTDGEIVGRGYMRERFKSMLTVVLVILGLAFSMVVLVYGPVLLSRNIVHTPFTDAINDIWLAFRWLVVLLLYFGVVSLTYAALPTRRIRYRNILPGIIFTSIGLIAVSSVFYFYVNFTANYDVLYGSLANVVALMFWFWFVGWVLIIGIVFNRVWWAERKKDPIPIPEHIVDRRNPMSIL